MTLRLVDRGEPPIESDEGTISASTHSGRSKTQWLSQRRGPGIIPSFRALSAGKRLWLPLVFVLACSS